MRRCAIVARSFCKRRIDMRTSCHLLVHQMMAGTRKFLVCIAKPLRQITNGITSFCAHFELFMHICSVIIIIITIIKIIMNVGVHMVYFTILHFIVHSFKRCHRHRCRHYECAGPHSDASVSPFISFGELSLAILLLKSVK